MRRRRLVVAVRVRREPARGAVRREAELRTPSSIGPAASKPPGLLTVGLDGGWVASREQAGGMEGKVAVVATGSEAAGTAGRKRLSVRRLAATLGDGRLMGELACEAAHGLGGYEAERQVVVADGAGWIKTQADWHFPHAAKVLDWTHLWRSVAKAVRAGRPGWKRHA